MAMGRSLCGSIHSSAALVTVPNPRATADSGYGAPWLQELPTTGGFDGLWKEHRCFGNHPCLRKTHVYSWNYQIVRKDTQAITTPKVDESIHDSRCVTNTRALDDLCSVSTLDRQPLYGHAEAPSRPMKEKEQIADLFTQRNS